MESKLLLIKYGLQLIKFYFCSGHFGLWLDESLYHGSSLSCDTFNNEPLTSTEDFIIHGVEAWGFV